MKYILGLSTVLFLLSLVTSCEIFDVVEFEEPNRYEGCCGTRAVVDTFENAIISIPNAITPNVDGKNDAFSIYSSDVMQITSLQVTEQNDLLGIDRKDIPVKRGWTEIWVPKNASGIVIQGLYNYSLSLKNAKGLEKTITGQFCAFLCGEKKVETIPMGDCEFRTQVGMDGQFGAETPSQDTCSL